MPPFEIFDFGPPNEPQGLQNYPQGLHNEPQGSQKLAPGTQKLPPKGGFRTLVGLQKFRKKKFEFYLGRPTIR